MENLFFYLIKVIGTSGVLFGYYLLFLKDKTFHHYNRYYLLCSVLVAVFLPLVKISYFTINVNQDVDVLLSKIQTPISQNSISHGFFIFQVLPYFVAVVAFTLMVRLGWSIFKVRQFKKIFPKQDFAGIHFYTTNLSSAPFSYFKNLFWKDDIHLDSNVGRQILKHEMVHIEQYHSVDKLFLETFCALFWMNPIFFLIKKELHLIHEYLADAQSVKHTDTKSFAEMILASHFSNSVQTLTSPFLSSNIKKRIIMLQKPKTKYSYVSRIAALPLLFCLGFAFLVSARNTEIRSINQEVARVIKSDTLAPKSKVDSTSKKVMSIKLKKTDQTQLSQLSKELSEKTTELKSMDSKTPEFSKKVDEISKLGDQINQLSKTKEFSIDEVDFSKLPDLRNLLDEKKLDELKSFYLFNNTDFEKLNSKDFEMDFDGSEIDQKKLHDMMSRLKEKIKTSPDAKVIISKWTESLSKDAENASKSAELSAKDAEKISKLAREKAKLAMKQADISKKIAEIKKSSAVELAKKRSGDNMGFKLNKEKLMINSLDATDVKYYINDVETTKTDFEKLAPSSIKSVNIMKTNGKGKIFVQTK